MQLPPVLARASRVNRGLLAAVAVALIVLWPVLVSRGYVLTYDMVFVPSPPLTDRLLGLDGSLPRAVPSDLAAAVASRALPGDVAQKVILLSILVGAGWGASRLAGRAGGPGVVAALMYVWNPFVYERLVIGHWALLVSYAVLPWLVTAALDVRAGVPGARARRAAALSAAALGGAAGWPTVATVVVGFALWRGGQRRRTPELFEVLGLLVILSGPWWVPSVLRPGGVPADVDGVAAFAVRPDSLVGTLGTVISLGGIWNAEVVPPGRGTIAVAMAALIVAVLALGGAVYTLRRIPPLRPLGAVAAVGLVIAVAGVTPGLDGALRWAVVHVPGGGLVRDGHKLVAALALLESVGLAWAVGAVADALTDVRLRRATATLAALAPIALLPGLAWGLAGRLRSERYPDAWYDARAAVRKDPGLVVSLPWSLYRQYAWNGDRTVLDPAPRFLPARVVGDDDLLLPGLEVAGEDLLSARLDEVVPTAVDLRATLTEHGVRWILVAGSDPSADAALAGLAPVVSSAELRLYRIDPLPTGPPPLEARRPAAGWVVVTDVAAGMVAGCAIGLTARLRLAPRRAALAPSDPEV